MLEFTLRVFTLLFRTCSQKYREFFFQVLYILNVYQNQSDDELHFFVYLCDKPFVKVMLCEY